jgi:VanZ family protein
LWGLLALHSGFIFWLSSGSLDSTDAVHVPGLDKVVHVGLFGLWAVLFSRALARSCRSMGAWTLAVSTVAATCAWGILDEAHQLSVPGRTADPWDLAADAGGAVLAVAGLALWRRARRSRVE